MAQTTHRTRISARSVAGITFATSLLATACGAQTDPDLGPTAPVRETVPCTVTRIVDGDTIECEPVGRIRLLGIDTPELAQEPFGSLASEALERLIPEGRMVRVEPDVEDRDRYQRALRYVWVDSTMVNWAIVRSGHAVLLTYQPNVQWVDALEEAQINAREEGLGLWSMEGFDCPPRDFRNGSCR
jgi:micrococcal nuclease